MEQPNPPNSPTNHSSQNPPTPNEDPTPNKEDELYTTDGWTSKEDGIFEKLWCHFEGVASPIFFQHVAHEIPWRSMNAIKIHYENYMRDLDLINPFYEGEVILEDEVEDEVEDNNS
ncbi:hypothetical protein AgCh_001740 [Apium graveolens]